MAQQTEIDKNPDALVDKKASAATGGAIGLSAIASFVGLCCIGPWAVSLFGISGAIAMARWQPYRPLILTVAGALLLWAFWRVYRPQQIDQCDADTCKTGASNWLKLSLWVAAVLVGVAFFADELQWLLIDPTPEGLK